MFLASQKYKALENNARANVHFFATYWDTSINVRKAIHSEQFSSCFEKFEDFDTVFKTVCCPPIPKGQSFARPRCLIIDKRYSQTDPADCCFFFEPQFDLPEFSVGSRDYLLIGWWASKQMHHTKNDIDQKLQRETDNLMAAYEGKEAENPDEGFFAAERVKAGEPRSRAEKRRVQQVNLMKRK